MYIKIIGYIASTLTTISFLPQAIKTLYTKDTKGISIVMYTLFNIGLLLWFVYGLLIEDLALILGNSITFVFSMMIFIVKVRNRIMHNEK